MRTDVVAQARTWLGVPFRHLGRNRQGVDCAGLVIQVGVELADPTLVAAQHKLREYQWGPTEARVREMLALGLAPKRAMPEPGDVGVFLLHREARRVTHVGIISDLHGGLGMIHASGEAKKVIEHTLDAERLAGVYIYRGVE